MTQKKDVEQLKAALFTYGNALEYLRDFVAASKREQADFSFRLFAEQSGFASRSTPKMLIDGKRRLGIDSARKLARGMRLTPHQTAYFLALVEYENAVTADEKADIVCRINSLRPRHVVAALNEAHREYLTDLNLVTLREMLHLVGFKEDPQWIGDSLKPRVAAKEVRRAFETLVRMGLIKRGRDGLLAPCEPVVSTPLEVADMDVFSYHMTMLKRAQEALANVHSDNRHNAALTFPVPLRKMKEIKKRILSFQKSLIELVDDGKGDFDDVFHVCVALFPATTVKGGSAG